MLIFTVPKPFIGHVADIQFNAIRSWTQITPRPRVVMMGDEAGMSEAARMLDVEHQREVARNEHGTPLVSDIFRLGEEMAGDGIASYVNADIILMDDFQRAAVRVAAAQKRFLMVGQRTDFELAGRLSFDDRWQEVLRADVLIRGKLHGPSGIDYFAFRGPTWGQLPPFALGRSAWDNWLIYRIRALGLPVVDASRVVLAIHQSHGYAHVAGDLHGAWFGEEAMRNKELSGGPPHLFQIYDATHVLARRGQAGVGSGHPDDAVPLVLRRVRTRPELERRWTRQLVLDRDRGYLQLNRRRLLHFLTRRRNWFGGWPWKMLAPYLMK